MKPFVWVACLMLLTATGVDARADDDVAALTHLKTVLWPTAYRTQDTELLDRILHDSFEVITAAGDVSTKADELRQLETTPWNPGEFEYRIERLDVYEDVAVISGTGIATGYCYKSSNVLIRDDGQWRAIASHVSGYEETGR